MIGVDWSGYGHVLNCMATGTVTGDDKLGGIAGTSYGNTLYVGMNYFDADKNPGLPGISDYSDPNIAGMTTASMQMQSTFTSAGWDFVGEDGNGFKDFWWLCVDGVSYPKLSWQSKAGDFECSDGIGGEDLAFFADKWLMTDRYGFVFADIEVDGVVDIEDLLILSNNWLENNCYECGADFDGDYKVNFLEFSILSKHWGQYDFGRADLNNDGDVTLADFAIFADNWMEGIPAPADINSPVPDPMRFDLSPMKYMGAQGWFIQMTATFAVDDSGGDVWYEFRCLEDSDLSSGWQLNNRNYAVQIVSSSQNFSFQVRASDAAGNTTDWSDCACSGLTGCTQCP